MRLAFLGTPEAAVPVLRALVDAGHDVEVVITRPDRRRGRGSQLSPTPVKAAALELGLTVAHRVADLENYTVERGIIVAYGAMIPGALLERVPMLNVHFSLLPRWRGAAPVERAILAGDAETGVAIMSLEPSLDTGPVHLEVRTRIGDKTAKELTEELALLGASALVEVLASEELLNHPTVQSGDVTYAEKLDKETLHLEPGKPLATLERTVRLGGAFTFVNERRVAVMRAHGVHVDANAGTLLEVPGGIALVGSDGALVLDTVRPEGSRPMSSAAWWAGARADIASSRWA